MYLLSLGKGNEGKYEGYRKTFINIRYPTVKGPAEKVQGIQQPHVIFKKTDY